MFTCKACKKEFDDAMRAATNLQCRPCRAAYTKAWRERNPGYNDAHNRSYYAENRSLIRLQQKEYQSRPENQAKAKARSKAWVRDNPERVRVWESANWDKRRLQAMARHKKRMRTDPVYAAKHRAALRAVRKLRWTIATSMLARLYAAETAAFYANCPEGHEVDHIEPMVRHDRTGLHVPWNLQYLPTIDNRRKGNRVIEETPCTSAPV